MVVDEAWVAEGEKASGGAAADYQSMGTFQGNAPKPANAANAMGRPPSAALPFPCSRFLSDLPLAAANCELSRHQERLLAQSSAALSPAEERGHLQSRSLGVSAAVMSCAIMS